MTTPDIMSTLLGPYKDTKPSENDMKMLRGDSQLIVVAGRSLSLSKYLGSIALTLSFLVTQPPQL